ncbi:MAG: lysophospholipid acyltransferase family protein [Gemmatimonadales bacterium]|nr:lysophospholipid acyltransferase family protein [Gemmatimonadales bacterium]
MLRTVLRYGFGRVLSLFFRRIDIVGRERVPAEGPVLFAINHPNGLVDPLLLLSFAPRAVSFLGKAPLFSMPVIGWFVRALDTIPVYRRQDQADTGQNRETFARARALLERGGTIAIAPEGASHSDPGLRPLKTGAARIALGAGTTSPVRIVPVGLFYTDKATFRSEALILFGEPLVVPPVPLDDRGEPPADRVDQITAELERRLAAVVLQADEHEALELAARAERILSAAGDPKARTVDAAFATRRQLAAGYQTLRERDPALLDRLRRRLERLDQAFRRARLDPTRPVPPRPTLRSVTAALGWLLLRVVIFLPLALPGLLLHFPAYWAIGRLARRFTGPSDDVLATAKIIGAALLYPLTWIAVGVLGFRWGGWPGAAAGAFLAPLSGVAALSLVERFDRFVSGTRALGVHLVDADRVAALVGEREALRRDLITLAGQLGQLPPSRG